MRRNDDAPQGCGGGGEPASVSTATRPPAWRQTALTAAAASVALALSALVIGASNPRDDDAAEPPAMQQPATADVQQHSSDNANPTPPAPATGREAEPANDGQTQLKSFDGRPLRKAGTMTMKVTAYSPDERSCGKWADGITASGYSVFTNGMRLVAADTDVLPFGTVISVPGYNDGEPVQVLDVGGAIKGPRLDVLYATHERAREWGVQELEVTIWEYADEE